MSGKSQTMRTASTTQVDIVTPALGPVPALYIPLRGRSVQRVRKPASNS